MSKKIIICCDGTWNTPSQKERGQPAPTNVVKISNAILNDRDSDQVQGRMRQSVFYHTGVGTEGSWWDKLMGGGTGKGLDKNIMSPYLELCERYEDGDEIYVFGFSRGAYTVRSLVGMVSHCGLLDLKGLTESDQWSRIGTVYHQCYRRHAIEPKDLQGRKWKFKTGPGMPVRFVGVWDTVGALGIPDDMAFLNLIDSLHDYSFHDTSLAPNIKTARHAVALDEIRGTFQPTMWTGTENHPDVKQLWFPGVHSDVGGGYRETGLSDAALLWMIEEARTTGLCFKNNVEQKLNPKADDVLHDSCDSIFALLPTQPRSAPFIEANRQAIHPSAVERQNDPPLEQGSYRKNEKLAVGESLALDVFASNPWNPTGIYLEGGKTYSFQASGEWLDSDIPCGPGGAADGKFHAGELAHVAGTIIGKVEEAFKAISGNKAADFKFTRRHEQAPWFCLMGSIANGGGVDVKGHSHPSETFAIGSGCTHVPRADGHLYAFANDAWNFYGNNRGRVRLTLKRTK